jgi:hypothetical protein
MGILFIVIICAFTVHGSALFHLLDIGRAHAATGDCLNISDDKARLSCFDAEARAATEQKTKSLNAALSSGKWRVEWSKDELTLAKKLTLALIADSATVFASNSRSPDTAIAVISCANRKLTMYFKFPDSLVASQSGVSIQYRIGEAAPKNSVWEPSQDSEAFGPWNSSEARNMARAMMLADELYIESSTRTFSSTRARFDIRGLKQALAGAQECGNLS